MKKLLIASTALVATAGMAAAEVSLSGYAEMGIFNDGTDTVFHNDIDVTFNLSGETDSGLTFGATIDLDEVTNAGDDNGIPAQSNDASVWIKGGFGNLTLGDTDGAFDWAMSEVGMISAIADDHTTHAGFNFNSGLDGSGTGQVLRYDNTFGDFSVALSYEMGASATASTFAVSTTSAIVTTVAGTAATDDVLGVAVKYTADLGGTTLGLGLGYQKQDTVDVVGISATTSFGAVNVALNYSDHSVDGTHMGIGLGYTAGDLSLAANYGDYESGADGFGLAANYSLGGGAVVMAGYGNSSTGTDTYSLGLGLSF